MFRSATTQGSALCSSSALGSYFTAFHDMEIPVLAWIHELSTVIDTLGGQSLVKSISRAARRIIVPTHQVRQSFVETYKLDPRQLVTIHYGVNMPDASEDAASARKKIRDDLGLPPHSLIVLGCGLWRGVRVAICSCSSHGLCFMK